MTIEEELKYYKEAYERQKAARKEAERILEQKAIQLYKKNEDLNVLNTQLEKNLSMRMEQIQSNEKSFEEIINTASDIIYRVDKAGNFKYVNQSAVEISGYTRKELLSMNVGDLVIHPTFENIIDFYTSQIENNLENTYFEYQIQSKIGKKIWLGQNVQLANYPDEIEFIGIARNITEKVEMNTILRRSEKKYRNLLENLDLGVIEVDLDDRIVKVYDSFCKLTGYKEEELVGKKPSELILHPDSKKTIETQNKLRIKGEASAYEIKILTKSGDIRWVMISGAPFYDDSGKIEGTIGIHLDITDQKILAKNLLLAKDQAESMSKAKELFLANMSHEIRTPLNAIIGLAQLLDKTGLTGKQKDYTTTILESANNLAALVKNILDFSKIESGNLVLDNSAFNLYDLLNTILNPFHFQIEQKGLQCDCDLTLNKDQYYLSDKLRLTQVVTNLLNNAIKFTPKGTVKLEAKILNTNEIFDEIFFSISDTGIGIKKESKANIFGDFIQANDQISSNYGGTGLGLSISKKIVGALGSELNFISEENKGSSFFFSIRLEKTEYANQENGINVESAINWHQCRIMVAEDNKVNQLVITEILKSWGAQVYICENGQEVLENIDVVDPSVILMDIKMPKMDGEKCTQILRNDVGLSIPIIGLTANVVKGDLEKYLQIGMNDCVSKPFKEDTLKKTIARYLYNAALSSVYQMLDIQKLESNVPDEKMIMKLLEIFIDESTEQLEAVQNLEDIPLIIAIIHKMKASVGILGKASLLDEMNHLENVTPFDQKLYHQFLSHWELLNSEIIEEFQKRK